MPFQRLFGLTAAIVLAAAGPVRAQNSTLEIDALTSQLGACLGAIEQGESQVYGDARNPAVEPCLQFALAFESYRPDRSEWNDQFDIMAAGIEYRGAGNCFKSARFMVDPVKMERVADFFWDSWPQLAALYREGRIQQFAAASKVFSVEVLSASREPTQYEPTPDAGYWNANCAGAFGTVREDIAAAPSPEAGFELSATQDTLTVVGVIGPDFGQDLIDMIEANQFVRQLILSSVGGTDVEEAMRAGWIIRDRGLHVRAVGNCESACTMLFVAGAARYVGSKSAGAVTHGSIGFHRMSVFGMPIPDDSDLYSKVALYFRSMGANPGAVLGFMRRNEGLAFYYPTLDELCAADVIGIPGPGPGLSMILGNDSVCEKVRFLDRYENYLRRPDLSDG